MNSFKRFEDIKVWKLAREIAVEIHSHCLIPGLDRDFALKGQMGRSSGSMMDNIAEGFERNGNREFIQFLAIAKGSAGELSSQLYRSMDKKYISTEQFNLTNSKVEKFRKMISALISYLKSSELKGVKYKDRN